VNAMNQDATFRIVIVICFAVFMALGVRHRIRSQSTGEPLDRRQEGWFILSTLRSMGLLMWGGVVVYMVNPSWMAWSSLPLPAFIRWMGLAVFALAATMFRWALNTLGPNLTDTVVTRRAHTLVTRGPYRWVRHPFYDAAALMILAISLLTANWFLLLAGCTVMLLLVIRTRTEEANLVARFGDVYRDYMLQTGRFVPKSKKAAGPDAV